LLCLTNHASLPLLDATTDPLRAADALLGEIDSEARSVFVSQLAAKLTSRDLGLFFEDKLGDRTVTDARIVTDRVSRRSKGYACFTTYPCNR
jgi:hypothetical protein